MSAPRPGTGLPGPGPDEPDPAVGDPVAALREIAFWRERARFDSHRVKAYRNAADTVAALDRNRIEQLGVSATAWQRLPGIGGSTAKAICESRAGRVPQALAAARADAEPVLPPQDEAGLALAALLRGDLHSHSIESDGGVPLVEMAMVARALGREYQAITDHSPRLTVARGLSPERLRDQIARIAALNEELAARHAEAGAAGEPFRVLTGIEVDILSDGSLDQEPDLLAQLDVVVASIHSELRMESAAMTRRMVTAVANPHVDVLGHCTGRKVEGGKTRPPSTFEAEIVFEACHAFGTAVEINSRPERVDPPDDLLALAAETDCLFSIDSDAHAPGQLGWLPLGASRAARAGIDAERIITTWPLERLLAWTGSAGLP